MALSKTWKSSLGLLLVFGLGVGLIVLHISHALEEEETIRTFMYGILIPLIFTLGIVVSGGWLWRSDFDGSHVLRISLWCWGGAFASAMVVGLLILYEYAEGVVLSHTHYLVGNAVSGGALVGIVVGVYQVRGLQAQNRAEQMSQQLTVLNRILRHDIRNRATVIHGYAGNLREGNGHKKHAATIQREALELVQVGDNAQDLERLLHQEYDREVVDVGDKLHEQLDRIRRMYPSVDLEASIPEHAYVLAHPLIETALVNLLENAVEHNTSDAARVGVQCTRETHATAEYVEITIADNGPGIPDEELEVIERGYETPLDHASGLGLWLVNWIANESKGDIRFETNPTDGTTASLRLEATNCEALDTAKPIPQ